MKRIGGEKKILSCGKSCLLQQVCGKTDRSNRSSSTCNSITLGSSVKSISVDLDAYTMKRFSNDVVFYWRILKDSKELEGILVANSTTWIGIGWRPSDLGPSCRSFPMISDRSEPLPKPEPKSEPVAETEPQAEPEPEAEPEPRSEPGIDGEKSIAKRRSAKADTATFGVTSPPDVTVQTSVTYQVSTKQGKFYLSICYIVIHRKSSSRYIQY